MAAPKVLISDSLSPAAVDIFKSRGVETDMKVGLKPDQLKEIIGGYDGLAVRSATKVTADVLAVAPRLRVVGRAGIGVDNIDIDAATNRGVVVMNTPFGNTITTAEHTISMMMSLARSLPAADASTRAGKWEKNRFMGVELYGKTLGVIGCGNIGAIVCDRALGLKMRVVAFDPFLTDERAADLGVEKVSLDDLLARADVITVHTPLTDKTRGIIDRAALAKAKKGVMIINCARGGLVVEADLAEALKSGHVAGAAFDVFEAEPATADNPLFAFENFFSTPHLGASTMEAQENVALQIAEQMSDYLLTGAVSNALNMPSVSAEDAPKLRPYMLLAGQIGALAGQINEAGPEAVELAYMGDVAALNTRPLTSIVLKGLLEPQLDSVNMVNAPLIARQRDIAVREVKSEDKADYHTLMRLTLTAGGETCTVAGTLFADRRPRIVEVNGIPVDAEVSPYMLYVRNQDRPGFIGALGTLLGHSGVNIGSFHLGRNSPEGDAIALLQLDQPVAEGLIAEVRALPHVLHAKALSFKA